MEIIFVRHTEKGDVGEDPFLTKKGVRQAVFLSKKLKKDKFSKFYCSNMNRAKQTADIISKAIKQKPVIEKSLNEFKTEILTKKKSKWNEEEKNRYNKIVSFIKKLTKKQDRAEKILIIAHGITNRIILSFLLDLNLKNIIKFRQSEGGINIVYWAKKFNNWRLKSWNDNNHIPDNLKHRSLNYLF